MTEPKPSELLNAALELMSEGWCQGWYARGAYLEPRCVGSNLAVSWCASGALMEVSLGKPYLHREADRYLTRAARQAGEIVPEINDFRGALATGRMYLRAIELAQRDGR